MNSSDSSREQRRADRLEIYTLGRFQVFCGEQKLFSESGRFQKIAELFMYFVTHRWKLTAPEIILESLWPDQENADPKNAFKNLVYRLKKKLDNHQMPGAMYAVSCSYGCYGWNNSVPFWLDAEAFESLCQEARSLAENDPILAIARYREALALYRGDYLPLWHYSDWVLPVRQYYRRLFVRSMSELLALQKECHLFAQMVEDFEKVLLIENLDETIHIRYMEALLEEKKVGRARTHYEHITSLFYQKLGAKPSPAMRRIYRTIKSAGEIPDLNFTDVREMLDERPSSERAMLCEPDVFHFLCRLERRRAERQDHPVHVGLLTFTGPNFQPLHPSRLQEAMEGLRRVLLIHLRKGDVVSFLNENQFAVLLPGLNLEQADHVLRRIQKRFGETYRLEGVFLNSFAYPVMPWE